MDNPGKSSTNSNGQIFGVKRADFPVIILLLIPILVSLVLLWENQSYCVNHKTQTEYRFENVTIIANVTSTISIENYFPFRSTQIASIVRYANGNTIHNSARALKAKNITIYSYSKESEYMGKEILPTSKTINPPNFPILKSFGMCNTTIIVNWSYNTSERILGRSPLIHLHMAPADTWLPQSAGNLGSIFYPILIYLFFVYTGFTFSWLAFGRGKFMKDYPSLARFTSEGWVQFTSKGRKKVTHEEEEKGLVKSLKRIIDFPNQIGSFWRMAFALSILIFKNIVNIKCKKHHDELDTYKKITPHKKEALKKVFSKYSKISFTAILDALPESKSIIVAIGFLASIGISFSWNLGAAAPFVVSIGLFYFFLNIGSLFYFVGKSKTDVFWTSLTMLAGIVIVSFPRIIDFFRTINLF